MTDGETELVVGPYAYCWLADGQGLCADGAPPEILPSSTMGDDSDLAITFPLDWQLHATFSPDGESCEGAAVIDVDPGGAPLEALGPADTYLVEMFGREEEGDGAWAFEMVTNTDRSMPPPYVQVFWGPAQGDLQPTPRPPPRSETFRAQRRVGRSHRHRIQRRVSSIRPGGG